MDSINVVLSKILNFLTQAKNISKKIIDKISTVLSNILKKLTPEKKDKFDKYFNKFQKQLSEKIKINLDKTEIDSAVKSALNIALSKNLIDKKNIQQSFNSNNKAIMDLIKSQISIKLDDAKEAVTTELESMDKEVTTTFSQKAISNLKSFSVGASFMAVFGMIDNLGLFVGMSAIEGWITSMGFDAQVAAGIGNTFSDAVGVMMGGLVSSLLFKLLKVRDAGTFSQNLVGVTVGCMLPVIIKMLMVI